jgi:rod shape-determining protein MreC
MREWLLRHRFGTTVTALLVLPLALMYFHGRRGGESFVEKVSITLAGFAQSWVSGLVEGTSDLVRDYVALVDVQGDNARLREENERLVGEALAAKRLAIENQALRKLIDLRQARRELRMAPAVVTGREVTPFYRVSRIQVETDTGSPEPDMAVVTREGLVGRVVSAAGRFADVMLLTDSRSRVACEILGRGVLGMLVGTGTPDQYQARLQVSVTEAPLEANAVVTTSGHDRVFPRGIEVGYVGDPSKRRQAGPFVEYDVVLAANPAAMEHVMVVLDAAGRER